MEEKDMKYHLQMDMGTPAFGTTPADRAVEVARILRGAAAAVEQIMCTVSIDLRDHNGNAVGEAGEVKE
jgi:hypothetical protein